MPDSINSTSTAIKSLEAEIIGFKAACTVIVDEVISVKDTLKAFLGNKRPPNQSMNARARGSQDSRISVQNNIVPIGPEVLDPPVTSISMLKTVHTEIHEKERRRHNVIVSGMKRDRSSQITDDIANFVRICSRYLDTDVGEYIVPGRCRRLGNLVPGKIQPLLIAFKTTNVPEKLLEVARNLRFVDEEYIAQHVFIGADLTPAEAELAFERRQQRRAKIALRQQPAPRVINVQPNAQASTSQSSSSQPSTSIDPAHNNHSSDIQADVLSPVISSESSVDFWLSADIETLVFPELLTNPLNSQCSSSQRYTSDDATVDSCIDSDDNIHSASFIHSDSEALFVLFNARSICNKLNEFHAMIDSVKPQLIAITETLVKWFRSRRIDWPEQPIFHIQAR